MVISAIKQHIAHPFTYNKIETISPNKQKALIISSVLLGVFTFGIGGLALFFGVSAAAKWSNNKKIEHLKDSVSPSAAKTDSLGQLIKPQVQLIKDSDGHYDPAAIVGPVNAPSLPSFVSITSQHRFQVRDHNIDAVLKDYQQPLWQHFDQLLNQPNPFQADFLAHLSHDPQFQQRMHQILGNNAAQHLHYLQNQRQLTPKDRGPFDQFNSNICQALLRGNPQFRQHLYDKYLESWYTSEVRNLDPRNRNYQIPHQDQKPIAYAIYMSYVMKNLDYMPRAIQEKVATAMSKTFLFTDPSFTPQEQYAHPNVLLPRGAVLATPCKMQYDAAWQPKQPMQEFALLNSAAINIGEREHGKSEDYQEYSKASGRFDEDHYVKDMQRIAGNLLTVAEAGKMDDVVWFPFGMGAFLRHLDQGDKRYSLGSTASFQLRKKLAAAYIKEFEKHKGVNKIHLCLPKLNPKDRHFIESRDNYNAFIEALNEADPTVKNRLVVYTNHDATQVAQDLAEKKKSYTVALVNGANQALVGNHCYESGAENAIDENIHRRSDRSLEASALCNEILPLGRPRDYVQPRNRSELEQRIKKYATWIPPHLKHQDPAKNYHLFQFNGQAVVGYA